MALFKTREIASRSIQGQLFLTLTLSLVAIFTVFWWLSQTALHTISESYLLTRLEHDKDLVEEHLVFRNDRWWMGSASIGPIYLTPHSGHYYAIQTPSQRFFSPSLGDFRLYMRPSNERVDVYETKGPAEQRVLVRSQLLHKDGQDVRIYIAENHEPIQRMVLRYDFLFAFLTLVALLSLYFLHKWLLRRAFGRLTPLEEELKAFRLGQSLGLREDDLPQEVHSLLHSLNLALEKSRLQFEQSRQHNSNLSHSLKTPLNLIFQLLEDPALRDKPELKTLLRQQSQRILELIERELKAERFAHNQIIQPLPLKPLVNDLQASFSRLYPQKSIRFECDVQENATLLIEQEDAFELLGNLLDNAYKWAHSKIHCAFDGQTLVIEDDGPGASDAQLASLLKRGYRTDESKPGHGIGLSIVKQLISAYKAELELDHSDLGGLKVTIRFSQISLAENS